MVFFTAPVRVVPRRQQRYVQRTRSTNAIHLGCRGTAENLLQFVFEDFEFVGSL
jgi:hypothetical protein